MTKKQENLLYLISKDFLSSTLIDTAILATRETVAVRFNFKDPKLLGNLKNGFKQLVKENATSVVTYNALVAVLEFSLNKQHVFETRLYIEMGSAATATIVVRTAIMKDRRIYLTLLYAIFSASIQGISAIFSHWQTGGEEYLCRICPFLHDAVVRNPLLPVMTNNQQHNDHAALPDQQAQ